MASRALLIGSQTHGLNGVHNDVDLMAETLEDMSFDVRIAIEEDATRDGIVRAYEQLIRDSSAGDSAIVYYSGHGGRSRNPERTDPLQSPYIQYILPTDIDDRSAGRFRGILAEELSVLQWRLTESTTNVCSIFDCCHSSRMTRNMNLIPRARNVGWPWESIRERWVEVKQSPAAQQMTLESNPNAVRLTACGVAQSAFEMYDPGLGQSQGLFTASLVALLTELEGAKVTWKTFIELLRPRVLDLGGGQRPEAEGPVDRVLFETGSVGSSAILPVVEEGRDRFLDHASLYGISEGDRYELFAPGGPSEEAVAIATVSSVSAGRARLELDRRLTASGALEAHPLEVSLGNRPVAIEAPDGESRDAITRVVEESRAVRTALDTDSPMATVRIEDGRFTLLDSEAEPYGESKEMSTGNLHTLNRNLARLACAIHLRELESGTGAESLDHSLRLHWQRVDNETEIDLETFGEQLFVGDGVRLTLTNDGTEGVWVSIFDVGLAGKITLLSSADPSGHKIEAGEEWDFPRSGAGDKIRIVLGWPQDLPKGLPRPETFMIIVSDQAQDLRALEQAGVRRAAQRGSRGSSLQRLMSDVSSGTRDAGIEGQGEVPVRFALHRLEFMLNPGARFKSAEPAFAIDERPDISMRMHVPRSVDPPPSSVAIRLLDLVVLKNRAWFSAGVRLDSLVVTRDANDSAESFVAKTYRFNAVGDNDRLSFENLRIFDGPVRGFLDIAIWVSREDTEGLNLASGLEGHVTDRDLQASPLHPAPVVGLDAPQADAVVGAVGAMAALVNTAAHFLNRSTQESIGLYRNSLLPYERFGVGRHPQRGQMETQDMSLAYEIINTDETRGD